MQPFDRLEPLSAHVRRALADADQGQARLDDRPPHDRRRRPAGRRPDARRRQALPRVRRRLRACPSPRSAPSRPARPSAWARSPSRPASTSRSRTAPRRSPHARRTLSKHRLVVVDLPPVEAGDAASLDRVAELLEALRAERDAPRRARLDVRRLRARAPARPDGPDEGAPAARHARRRRARRRRRRRLAGLARPGLVRLRRRAARSPGSTRRSRTSSRGWCCSEAPGRQRARSRSASPTSRASCTAASRT